jgi:hypothetical protein
MKKTLIIASLCLVSTANASELVHEFKSPAFSGVGYSSHVLTIEQLESNRKQKIKDDQRAAEEKAERDLKSTNAYKFQNNLESRIYAEMSSRIAKQLFGEGDPLKVEGEAKTPFGDTIVWKRTGDVISVTVKNSNGDTVADFSVPVGEFAF